MFSDHFKMTHQPFLERIPSERIWKDERFSQGLSRLQYLLHAGTIALLTGQTGVGKSTLLRLFLQSLSANHYNGLYLHITHIRTTALLKLIVSAMGEIPAPTKGQLFTQILDKAQKAEAVTILVIDESHLLSKDALTDLRLLVSSALDETAPLRIILSGQETLRQQLRQSCHLALAQRICVSYHLASLTKDQTVAYLDYQMNSCGSNDRVFEPEVKALIHEYCSGIPRQINNICTACLIAAAVANTPKVNQAIFTIALRECQI